ncbi:hypothetical protein N9937_02095 [bacterium]|nr:hypothetical protein [bacterium]
MPDHTCSLIHGDKLSPTAKQLLTEHYNTLTLPEKEIDRIASRILAGIRGEIREAVKDQKIQCNGEFHSIIAEHEKQLYSYGIFLKAVYAVCTLIIALLVYLK